MQKLKLSSLNPDLLSFSESNRILQLLWKRKLDLTKNHQSKAVYLSCGRELERYLNSLKIKVT